MDPIAIAFSFAVLVPAIIIHEVAHGWAAFLLGDSTAKDRGRLSLNPVRHIDLWGTILMPLLLVAIFGVGFGYAKPVPINPYRFKDYRQGMFLTGIAGPASNLILAFLSGLAFRGLGSGLLAEVVLHFAYMNLALLFFNLIPIPPLDGSRVLPLFLSDRAMDTYHSIEQYGFIILFGALWLIPQVTGFNPIGWYISNTVEPLLVLFAGLG